ncbi:MNIO family bufferin maturase [Legionella clemsonensis]|uniref:UPF0276 protein clem_03335 n=1 Tax=Legionella clemsonensis TaxID=1867846 RepID=A0A222P0B2_9GAMM|nr:DUF692 domain-containing protein [Legionella clemsonensis]ASQ45225.1 hypothetical protein clem_03335 [Legionella clemsonensis]
MASSIPQKLPYLGFGLGLRPEHYEEILQTSPAIDWFEIITENYLIPGGKPLYFLDKIRENYPVVMHGVSLSLGTTDALNWDYLKQVKELVTRIEPQWISDHLCWTGINGFNLHDLLPLPYTLDAIEHVVARIHVIQDYFGQQILIENVSSYLSYKESEMSEWAFISEITNRTGCYLLCDVNNIYVSSVNHGFDALDYLNGIPAARVAQIHLAGHSNFGDYIIDTHDAPVIQPVWELYAEAIKRFGLISTMIERDGNIPPLAELLLELSQAKKIASTVNESVL